MPNVCQKTKYSSLVASGVGSISSWQGFSDAYSQLDTSAFDIIIFITRQFIELTGVNNY